MLCTLLLTLVIVSDFNQIYGRISKINLWFNNKLNMLCFSMNGVFYYYSIVVYGLAIYVVA
jgi:hypothetical protein